MTIQFKSAPARVGGARERDGRTGRRSTSTAAARTGGARTASTSRPSRVRTRRTRPEGPVTTPARRSAGARAYAKRTERTQRLRQVAARSSGSVAVQRVPFVAFVILLLAAGLVGTLWLSSRSADYSYDIGAAQESNERLSERAQALRRDVAVADSTSVLAERALALGMVPAGDVAHLVVGADGTVSVVGTPAPAAGPPAPVAPEATPDPNAQPPATPDPNAQPPATPAPDPADPATPDPASTTPAPDVADPDALAEGADPAADPPSSAPTGITAGADPDPNSAGA